MTMNSAEGVQSVLPAALRSRRVPATFAQRRLWFVEHLQPGNLGYLIVWKIRLVGDLRPALLEETLNALVARHKVFRTTFEESDGDVVQVIAPSGQIEMDRNDLRNAADPEAALAALVAEQQGKPLDL